MSRSIIDNIFAIFDRLGALSYGEDTSQIEHALQTAELARSNHCSQALVAAALLHDIGQFMNDAGSAAGTRGIDARHEVTGAGFLRRHFPDAVTEPVRLHVVAKRYLCMVDPTYSEDLSDASKLSLALQGGPMSEAEAAAFETTPFFADAVQLRRFDDMGKQPGCTVPGLESHRVRLEGLLRVDA